MSNAVLEALAAGRAVVASAIPGMDELIEHEKSGLLIEADDPDTLAGAIARLHEDPTLRERLGSAGRKAVLAQFPIERPVRLLERLYEELAGLV